MRILTIVCAILLFALNACIDKPETIVPLFEQGNIWVVNEGNFNLGNASIGFITPDYAYHSGLFEKSNSRKPGDVIQDFKKLGDYIYMVVNNSGKIEKLQTSDLKSVGLNDKFSSPRKVCFWDNETAYVSELYKGVIYKIQLSDLAITDEISLPGWTEDMVKIGEKLFIVNIDSRKLMVFQPGLKRITDSLALPEMPGEMLVDAANKLWIYCGGTTGGQSHILRIDPENLQILTDLVSSPIKEFFPRMTSNLTKDSLWILNGGIYKISVNDKVLPLKQTILPVKGHYYGLGINQSNGDVLVSEVASYTQPANIYIYSSEGDLKSGPIKGEMITSRFLN